MLLKEQIRKIIVDHLTTKGYPNLTEQQIMAELKPMWIKLEEAKLLQPGWTFPQFVKIANEQMIYNATKTSMEAELLKHFSRRVR